MKPLKSPALMFSRIKTGLILFGLLLFTPQTHASEGPHLSKAELEEIRTLGVEVPQEIQTLLAQRQRPLPHDLLAAFGGKLPENMPDYLNINDQIRFSDFNELVPRLIAALERIWPNSKYVSLGRDAAITTDILDAFYRNLGQADRTARINASGASVRPNGKFVGAQTINPFLERTIGLNLKSIEKARPVVMMDRTGFNGGSQSKMILEGLYSSAIRGGIPRTKLPDLLSFASLDPDYEGLTPYELEHFILRQKKELGSGARIFSGIPTITGYTDSAEWHDTWSTFRKLNDGKKGTLPGKPSSIRERLEVLGDFYVILSKLQTPEFKKALLQAFREFNVKFDPTGKTKPRALRKTNLDLLGHKAEILAQEADNKIRKRVEDLTKVLTHKKNHDDTDYLVKEFFVEVSEELETKRDDREKDRHFFEEMQEKSAALLFHYAVRAYRKGELPKESLTLIFDHCFHVIETDSKSKETQTLAFQQLKKDLSLKGVLEGVSAYQPHFGFHTKRKLMNRRTRLLR